MHVERLLSLSNLILVMNMIYQPLLCFSITTQLTYPLTDGRVTINQSGYNKMSLFLIMTNLRMKLILFFHFGFPSQILPLQYTRNSPLGVLVGCMEHYPPSPPY